ncbi:MAG: hypothetical protein IH790_08360, partial [Acidobacteria bacterium]|nr:hypothetical protein [Acidobacteriota bacterium]
MSGRECRWNTHPQGDGGGMFNGGAGATPLVVDCEFSDNQSGWGGGMYNEDGSAPIVIGSSFINNFA